MTRVEAAKLVAMLLQAYPSAQFGPASSALYERMLADLDAGVCGAAVERLIGTSKWLPTIAEIRAMAADLRHGARRLGVEAYGDVVEATRRVGSYRPPPEFADPLVAECVKLLGWRNLCRGENEASDRARFIELYDGLSERQRTDAAAGRTLPAPARGYTPTLPGTQVRRLPEAPQLAKAQTAEELDEALQGGSR